MSFLSKIIILPFMRINFEICNKQWFFIKNMRINFRRTTKVSRFSFPKNWTLNWIGPKLVQSKSKPKWMTWNPPTPPQNSHSPSHILRVSLSHTNLTFHPIINFSKHKNLSNYYLNSLQKGHLILLEILEASYNSNSQR